MAEPKRSFPRWWAVPARVRPMARRARRKSVHRRQAHETKWRGRAFCSSTWRDARKVISSTRRELPEGFRAASRNLRALPSRLSRDGLQPLCAFHVPDFLDAPSEDARLAVSILAGWAGAKHSFFARTKQSAEPARRA